LPDLWRTLEPVKATAAVVTAAWDRGASIQEPTDFASVTGKGGYR
jgi:hypothetical protein